MNSAEKSVTCFMQKDFVNIKCLYEINVSGRGFRSAANGMATLYVIFDYLFC